MDKEKFRITNFIINNYDSFQQWLSDNGKKIEEKYNIIGYLFDAKSGSTFGVKTYELNLYLINNKYSIIDNSLISFEDLANAWELFFHKIKDSKLKSSDVYVFKNPPIEYWLNTKENWCKKVASQLAIQFGKTYDDMLSETYMSIMKVYHKGTIYMGNLNYIRKSIYTSVLMDMRNNRNRLNGDGLVGMSLDTLISENENDALALSDIIPVEKSLDELSLEYEDTKKSLISLLSDTFSVREIEQIIKMAENGSTINSSLPQSLYRRLARWRDNHSIEEVL